MHRAGTGHGGGFGGGSRTRVGSRHPGEDTGKIRCRNFPEPAAARDAASGMSSTVAGNLDDSPPSGAAGGAIHHTAGRAASGRAGGAPRATATPWRSGPTRHREFARVRPRMPAKPAPQESAAIRRARAVRPVRGFPSVGDGPVSRRPRRISPAGRMAPVRAVGRQGADAQRCLARSRASAKALLIGGVDGFG